MNRYSMNTGALYLHYKGRPYGGFYHVICEAINEKSGETLVVYADAEGRKYARPKGEFCSLVLHNGEAVPRFKLVRE